MHYFCVRSYLGEFEAEFKKPLARESGAQGVLFDEKNRESKISWHCHYTVKGARGKVSFDSQTDQYVSQLSSDASPDAYLSLRKMKSAFVILEVRDIYTYSV
jgi:hypothetical protein